MQIKSYKGRAVSQIIPVGGEAYKVVFADGGIGFANLEALTGQSQLAKEQGAMKAVLTQEPATQVEMNEAVQIMDPMKSKYLKNEDI